jgi:hypothetical protein
MTRPPPFLHMLPSCMVIVYHPCAEEGKEKRRRRRRTWRRRKHHGPSSLVFLLSIGQRTLEMKRSSCVVITHQIHSSQYPPADPVRNPPSPSPESFVSYCHFNLHRLFFLCCLVDLTPFLRDTSARHIHPTPCKDKFGSLTEHGKLFVMFNHNLCHGLFAFYADSSTYYIFMHMPYIFSFKFVCYICHIYMFHLVFVCVFVLIRSYFM